MAVGQRHCVTGFPNKAKCNTRAIESSTESSSRMRYLQRQIHLATFAMITRTISFFGSFAIALTTRLGSMISHSEIPFAGMALTWDSSFHASVTIAWVLRM